MSMRKKISEIWIAYAFSKSMQKNKFRVEAVVPPDVSMPAEYTPTGSYDSVGRKYYFSAWFLDIKDAERAAYVLVRFLSINKAKPMMFREIRKPQPVRI